MARMLFSVGFYPSYFSLPRYQVARVLKEMQDLEKLPILNLKI